MKKLLPFLAVAFSGFLVYIFDKIWGNSINWEKVKSFKIGDYLTREISIYQIIFFLVIVMVIILIGRRILREKKQYYSKKQRKLREYNKTEIAENGILLRWGVFFDYDTPFINGLKAFCTKHDGPPIRFIHNHCPINGCENNRIEFNEFNVKNAIESDLIDRWDKIK